MMLSTPQKYTSIGLKDVELPRKTKKKDRETSGPGRQLKLLSCFLRNRTRPSRPTKSLTRSYDTYNSRYASIFLLSEPLYNEPENKAKERKRDSAEPKPSTIKGGVRPWVMALCAFYVRYE